MFRLMRFVAGAAMGAAGAFYISRRKGGDVRERARSRMRDFLREELAEEPTGQQAAPSAGPAPAPGVPVTPADTAIAPVVAESSVAAATPFPVAPPIVPFAGEVADEAPTAAQVSPEPLVADLRARVEETRQAVREVLDRPFAGEVEQEEAVQSVQEEAAPAAAADIVAEAPVPVTEQALVVAPVVEEEPPLQSVEAEVPTVEVPTAEAPAAEEAVAEEAPLAASGAQTPGAAEPAAVAAVEPAAAPLEDFAWIEPPAGAGLAAAAAAAAADIEPAAEAPGLAPIVEPVVEPAAETPQFAPTEPALVPEAAVKEVAATPSEEPIAAEPVPEVPEAVESAVPSFTQGDRPSVIEPVAIWPLPAEDAAAEAEALHITIPASETAPEAIEEPATVEAEAVESAVVPEAAEAEEPTQVLEAKGHEGVSPSDFLAPAPAEAEAEPEIAEPVAGAAPVGVAEPEVVAPAAEAEPEAVEPMVEEPEEQEPEAVEPPGEARAEMEPAGDVVAPAAVEEAGDVTEPIPAADLVAAPAADVTVAELASEAAAAAAGLTQPLAVWPAPEELESWPSRTRVETHPEPETTVPELVAEEGVDEDPEPAALAEPVAEEAPELVAEQADATPGPDDEKPAELDAMAGGAALMNADDLEPPMETTATPDLEAQTAAQPSDEAASALISEPVEPQTEEEKAQIDQADMRRRIEETRNRLKAKAFDAMASGEAALLARDAEGHEAPAVPEEHIDADVADALDRSLSPDDY